jgi:hypothetical protein
VNPSGLQLLLLLVGIPAVVVLVIVLATLAPGWTRAGRYRPGEPWNYEPIVINGRAGTDVKAAISVTSAGEFSEGRDLTIAKEGGASARW